MRIPRALADALHATLLLVAVALAAWLSVHWQARVDLSHGARSSLPQAARDALAALDGPLELVSYAREGGALRGTVAAFVQRYQVHKPDLALRFVDPDLDPGAMRARGITIDGEIVIAYGAREERIGELSDRELVRALLRLARPRERDVAFVSGHGERKPTGEANHDWGQFAAALGEQGVASRTLDLARDTLPEDVDLVVLADPRVAPGDPELAALDAHIERGGALLWLTEPASPVPLEALARTLGVRALPGTVVDAAGQELGIGDPSFVAIGSYPDHAATRGFDLTVVLPQAVALASLSAERFAAAPLLRSGERSWTESGAIADAIRYDEGGAEIPGPHDLALALTRLSPRPDRSMQRVVVVGDADFLANSYLGNGGNRALGLRLVNWLLADDALLDVAPAEARDRELRLGPIPAALVGLGFLVVLPILLLATGLAIAWRRRRR